jgi:hypothetical protein
MELKNRQQLLTLVAIAVVVLFAADKLVFSPLTGVWKGRNKRLTELRQQIEQGRSLVEREQAIRARWEQIRRASLPSNLSAAEQTFYQAIDRWAQESRVVVTALTPQWKRAADESVTLQCRIDANGSLGALSRFLYNIERDPMAIRLESVELGVRDKNGQQLALAAQVSGLVLNPQNQ